MNFENYKWKGGDLVTVNQMNRIEQGVLEMNEAYVPTVWQTGDTVTAEKLNKIEQGIVNAGSGADIPTVTVNDSTGIATCDWTYEEVVAEVNNNSSLPSIIHIEDDIEFSFGGTWIIDDSHVLCFVAFPNGSQILEYYSNGTIEPYNDSGGGGDIH